MHEGMHLNKFKSSIRIENKTKNKKQKQNLNGKSTIIFNSDYNVQH